MFEQLKKFAGRIDAMSMRERLMILVAAAATTFVFLDLLLVSSASAKLRRGTQDLELRQHEIKTLEAQLVTLESGPPIDPDAANRLRLAEAANRLKELDAEFERQATQLIPPERVRVLLERLLARRAGLQLVEFKTLPRVAISLTGALTGAPPQAAASGSQAAASGSQAAAAGAKPAVGAAPTAQGAAPPAPAGVGLRPAEATEKGGQMFKHGVELTLAGTYLDLLDYLREIEALPDRLYWDRLELAVTDHPMVMLKLTLFSVSVDKTWLQV